MFRLILLSSLVNVASSASIENRAAEESVSVLKNARSGDKVRQCSCEEEQKCVKEMKAQALGCVDPCWGTITKSPDALRECFDSKVHLLDGFIGCFEQKLDGCVENKAGPMIAKINISKLFELGEARLESQSGSFLATVHAPMRKVLETAREFGLCVKKCFEEKNAEGYCFDKVGCQPLVEEKKMIESLKTCSRQLNWKEEAGEACDCAVKAGVSQVAEYCPLLRAMKPKARR